VHPGVAVVVCWSLQGSSLAAAQARAWERLSGPIAGNLWGVTGKFDFRRMGNAHFVFHALPMWTAANLPPLSYCIVLIQAEFQPIQASQGKQYQASQCV
jgi:hypothetical protein